MTVNVPNSAVPLSTSPGPSQAWTSFFQNLATAFRRISPAPLNVPAGAVDEADIKVNPPWYIFFQNLTSGLNNITQYWNFYVRNTFGASEVVVSLDFQIAWRMVIGMPGGTFKFDVAATAQAIFTIWQNAVQIGTITVAAGSAIGTISFPVAIAFSSGDHFYILAPATPDATLAGGRFGLAANKV